MRRREIQHRRLLATQLSVDTQGTVASVRSSSPCSTGPTRPTWSATCSWRSSRRLQRAGVARIPSNLRCGPGTMTSDGITDVVQRVPVTSEENPFATEKDSWPLSRAFEGIGFHMTGDGNFPCRRRSEESDRMETTFFCVHPCSARNSENLENGIGRGVTNCMTCTEAVNRVGFSLLGRCSELRAQKRKNKSFTSYETCASMFITSERSGWHCLLFDIVAW